MQKRTSHTKLHIGCGRIYIPGFVHIDIQAAPHIDIVASADNLDMFSDGSVDLVYACHLLEHFDRWHYKGALSEWYRILKPNGVLRLAVPDFQACLDVYHRVGLVNGPFSILGLICGGQRESHDFHKMIFDHKLLSGVLTDVGFKTIRDWDWRKTEHAGVDDYSQAYIPHLDKANGTHVSLNIEAVKD